MEIRDKFSRRAALKGIGSLSVAFALKETLSPETANAAGPQKALALIGDRWHAYDYIKVALTKIFVKEEGISIDFTNETDIVTAKNLKKYKLLIMLMDGMTWPNGYPGPFHLIPEGMKLVSDPQVEGISAQNVMWIEKKEGQPDQGKVIQDFVRNGGGALLYHNTHYNSTANENFRDVCGATSLGHTKFRPFRMEITNSDHPIAKGVNDFTITEEQHFVGYDKDPKFVFMRSRDLDGIELIDKQNGNLGTTSHAGWAYDYGKGRICYMTPGHTIPTMWNPEFIKMQKNALKWVLKQT
jgi:type 1 glutamine amidotransferase